MIENLDMQGDFMISIWYVMSEVDRNTAMTLKQSTVRRLACHIRIRKNKEKYQKYMESLEDVLLRALDALDEKEGKTER